jgi:hypothetical protein
MYLWSHGFCIGYVRFLSCKDLGARRRFGNNLEMIDWNLGLVEASCHG